jgi:NitT/TauT family transport system substrate-binding protein
LKNRWILLALMVVVAVAGTAGWLVLNRPDPPLSALTISETVHSIFYAPQYVALNQNFFTDEGLNVSIEVGEGSRQTAAKLLSGQTDIALFSPEETVYSQAEEPGLIAFAVLAKRDGSFLVGRPGEPDFAWDNLSDKTVIGSRAGSLPAMVLDWVLSRRVSERRVKIVTDFALNTAAALQDGTADYVQLWEPDASLLEQSGNGQVVMALGQASGELPYAVYHTTGSFMEQHAHLVQKFARAIYRAERFVASHSAAEIAQCIAPYFPDAEDRLLTASIARYQQLAVWADDPLLREDLWDQLTAIMTDTGELHTEADYHSLVNTSCAEKAMRTVK